jgi:hypothetical protein
MEKVEHFKAHRPLTSQLQDGNQKEKDINGTHYSVVNVSETCPELFYKIKQKVKVLL